MIVEQAGTYTQFYIGGTITIGEVIELLKQVNPNYKLLVDDREHNSWCPFVDGIVADHDSESVFFY